jgi:hypothetical protein
MALILSGAFVVSVWTKVNTEDLRDIGFIPLLLGSVGTAVWAFVVLPWDKDVSSFGWVNLLQVVIGWPPLAWTSREIVRRLRLDAPFKAVGKFKRETMEDQFRKGWKDGYGSEPSKAVVDLGVKVTEHVVDVVTDVANDASSRKS